MGHYCIIMLFVFQVMYYTHMNISNYTVKMQVEIPEIIKFEVPLKSTEDYIKLSNVNLTFGGPIYPQFRNFYLPYLKSTQFYE
jgi:hypothetical protein